MPEESTGHVPYLDKSPHRGIGQVAAIKEQVFVPELVGAVVLPGVPVFEKRIGGQAVQQACMEEYTVEGRVEGLWGKFQRRGVLEVRMSDLLHTSLSRKALGMFRDKTLK